jgi:hypothetical protein
VAKDGHPAPWTIEERTHARRTHLVQAWRIPLRLVVLVDHQRADSLDAVAVTEHVMHHVELHPQFIFERHRASAADLFERDAEHQR